MGRRPGSPRSIQAGYGFRCVGRFERPVHESREVVQGLRKSLATMSFDPVGRAETEARIVSGTTALMRLGKKMLELDALVSTANAKRRV